MQSHTAHPTEHRPYPRSGLLVGLLAEAMRLKHALRDIEGISYKTAQRYFAGERVDPDNRDVIVRQVVQAWLPRPDLPDYLPHDVQRAVRGARDQMAIAVLQQWDQLVDGLTLFAVPIDRADDMPIPPLRLAVLDAGLRLGAWHHLLHGCNEEVPGLDIWLSGKALRHALDRWSKDGSTRLSVQELADEARVAHSTVKRWRSGKSLPNNEQIEALAGVVARGDARKRTRAEFQVRLAVGLTALLRLARETMGDERVDDFLQALRKTTTHTTRMLADAAPPPSAALEVVIHGARCDLGERLCRAFEDVAELSDEVATEFACLPGSWSERVNHWAHFLSDPERQARILQQQLERLGLPTALDMRQLLALSRVHLLRMGDFDRRPPPGSDVLVLRSQGEVKARRRMARGENALTAGRLDEGVEHFRVAIELLPGSAFAHFKLGAALGLQMVRGRPDLVEEAVQECRIAYTLDPSLHNARNEVGIILSNARRHEEAERAFAEAAPRCGELPHHFFTRGNNLMVLDRFDEAEANFRRVLEVLPDHLHARLALMAVLMHRGAEEEARHHAKRIERERGQDPLPYWPQWLDPWGHHAPSRGTAA